MSPGLLFCAFFPEDEGGWASFYLFRFHSVSCVAWVGGALCLLFTSVYGIFTKWKGKMFISSNISSFSLMASGCLVLKPSLPSCFYLDYSERRRRIKTLLGLLFVCLSFIYKNFTCLECICVSNVGVFSVGTCYVSTICSINYFPPVN